MKRLIILLCFMIIIISCKKETVDEVKEPTEELTKVEKIESQEETAFSIPELDKDIKEQTIVIGRASDQPRDDYGKFKPSVDYLASQLKDMGIERGDVILSKNDEELVKKLREGMIDIIRPSIYYAIKYQEEGIAEIIAKRSGHNNMVFFVRNDSDITGIDDFTDKKVAFEDPGSTSAFFTHLALLRKRGYDVVELSSPRAPVPEGKVGYTFAHGELNITTWIHKGMADIGAMSLSDWEEEEKVPDAYRKDLRIIYTSPPFTRSFYLVRNDMDKKLKQKLKTVLLHAHESEEGLSMIESGFFKTNQVLEIDETDITEIKQLYNYITNEL